MNLSLFHVSLVFLYRRINAQFEEAATKSFAEEIKVCSLSALQGMTKIKKVCTIDDISGAHRKIISIHGIFEDFQGTTPPAFAVLSHQTTLPLI